MYCHPEIFYYFQISWWTPRENAKFQAFHCQHRWDETILRLRKHCKFGPEDFRAVFLTVVKSDGITASLDLEKSYTSSLTTSAQLKDGKIILHDTVMLSAQDFCKLMMLYVSQILNTAESAIAHLVWDSEDSGMTLNLYGSHEAELRSSCICSFQASIEKSNNSCHRWIN